jgi:hypothetical protein
MSWVKIMPKISARNSAKVFSNHDVLGRMAKYLQSQFPYRSVRMRLCFRCGEIVGVFDGGGEYGCTCSQSSSLRRLP